MWHEGIGPVRLTTDETGTMIECWVEPVDRDDPAAAWGYVKYGHVVPTKRSSVAVYPRAQWRVEVDQYRRELDFSLTVVNTRKPHRSLIHRLFGGA